MTDLDPKLTFDTFVVGPANRLASAAARRAADSPGKSYNPLFIYSASGLGKSHILNAVAHHIVRQWDEPGVLYQTLEGYLEQLAKALESGERDQLRDRYRDLDILLLDDVQFLAGQPEAQEMLLSTLDALTASGSQIVLASDRPPAEINGLDARLVSRFSGGLMVDIGPPEYETRVAIIRRKVDERDQTLEPGVAEALARYPLRNVRELGGALNRILAVQDLEGRPVGPDDVPRLMDDGSSNGGGDPDDFGTFVDEIAHELEHAVQTREEPWRKGVREAIEAAEREGFTTRRLRALLHGTGEPDDWEDRIATFRDETTRLRRIDIELHQLGNPWPEAAQGVLSDPDRLDEAEALLASVRERQRPFPALGPGPDLGELSGRVPQLALKAAEQLVTADRPQYNPLYLWGEDTAAADALLGATARSYATTEGAERHVAVTSVSAFAEDFIRALSSGVAGAWRERWWTVDLLLVHGAQELSETERAQDEFFHLFEALKRRGSRVLITADRPPSGIEGIDERLRSRFEGGLVLELEATELPDGASDLTLHEPTTSRIGDATWDDDREEGGGPIIPPLEEFDLGEGRGGLFVESPGTGGHSGPGTTEEVAEPAGVASAESGWTPSFEKAVWQWPYLEERLVEDLE